jgi:hypothetical protein
MQIVTIAAVTKTAKGYTVELAGDTGAKSSLTVGARYSHIVLYRDGGYQPETRQNDGWAVTRHQTAAAAEKAAHDAWHVANCGGVGTVVELAAAAERTAQVAADMLAELGGPVTDDELDAVAVLAKLDADEQQREQTARDALAAMGWTPEQIDGAFAARAAQVRRVCRECGAAARYTIDGVSLCTSHRGLLPKYSAAELCR